jgi:hypothetical protein
MIPLVQHVELKKKKSINIIYKMYYVDKMCYKCIYDVGKENIK